MNNINKLIGDNKAVYVIYNPDNTEYIVKAAILHMAIKEARPDLAPVNLVSSERFTSLPAQLAGCFFWIGETPAQEDMHSNKLHVMRPSYVRKVISENNNRKIATSPLFAYIDGDWLDLVINDIRAMPSYTGGALLCASVFAMPDSRGITRMALNRIIQTGRMAEIATCTQTNDPGAYISNWLHEHSAKQNVRQELVALYREIEPSLNAQTSTEIANAKTINSLSGNRVILVHHVGRDANTVLSKCNALGYHIAVVVSHFDGASRLHYKVGRGSSISTTNVMEGLKLSSGSVVDNIQDIVTKLGKL